MNTEYLYRQFAFLIALITVAGCTALAPKPETSLFDRLGGQSAIEAVVSDFVDLVGADTRITNEVVKTRLASIDIPALKSHASNLVCGATGGPCQYTGRDMKSTHAGLGITNAEFDYVVDDLVETLNQYKVPEREKNELLGLLAPMRDDITEVQSYNP